jgi:hypothetical protein
MRLFSSLKSMFTSAPCTTGACIGQAQTLYTQKQVNELCDYWHEQIQRAKDQVRKECFLSMAETSMPISELEKPRKLGRPRKNKSCKKQKNAVCHSARRYNVDGKSAKHTMENSARRKKSNGCKKFIKDCCVYQNGVTSNSEELFEIYLWWCRLNKIDPQRGVKYLSYYIDKKRISYLNTTRNKKGISFYDGFGINSKTMKAYNDRNLPQVTNDDYVGKQT